MSQCAYPGCLNKRTRVTLRRKSFHYIPTSDPEVRTLWLTALGIDVNTPPDESKFLKVCSDHFEPDDFYPKEPENKDPSSPKKRPGLRTSKKKTNPRKERTRIRPHAVPRTTVSQVNFISVLIDCLLHSKAMTMYIIAFSFILTRFLIGLHSKPWMNTIIVIENNVQYERLRFYFTLIHNDLR